MNLIKTNSFCSAKDIVKKKKSQSIDRKKYILQITLLTNGFCPEYIMISENSKKGNLQPCSLIKLLSYLSEIFWGSQLQIGLSSYNLVERKTDSYWNNAKNTYVYGYERRELGKDTLYNISPILPLFWVVL